MPRLFCIVVWLLPFVVVASEEALVRLTLDEVLQRVAANNLGLKIAEMERVNAEESIAIQEATFDPTLSASANYSETTSASAGSSLDGADQPTSNSRSLRASLSKLIATGGTVDVSSNVTRSATNSSFSTLNPDYSANLSLGINQPLLKGFGRAITEAALQRARLSDEAARLRLAIQMRDTLTDAEAAYWRAAAQYKLIELSDSNIAAVQSVLDETQERFELGLTKKADVLLAEARLTDAINARYTAISNYLSSYHQLLRVQGDIEDEKRLGILSATKLPTYEAITYDAFPEVQLGEHKAVVEKASQNSYERELLELSSAQEAINLQQAEDNLMPQLNLTARYRLLGRDNDALDAYDGVGSRQGDSWSAGLELSLPWSFREERARKTIAQREARKVEAQIALENQRIAHDSITLWNSANLAQLDMESSRKSVEYYLFTLDSEAAEYENGLSKIRDILDAQVDLDNAQRRLLNAQLNTVLTQLELKRLMGE